MTGTCSLHHAAVTPHEKKLEMRGQNDAEVMLLDLV
jgi:hypothetical protein